MDKMEHDDFAFHRKAGSETDGISTEGIAKAGMNYAVSMGMIHIAYESKLINDATYRNITKKYGCRGGSDYEV